MKQKCAFKPLRDKGLVIDGLYPDINKMIEDHTIPDTTADVVYNQLSDIQDVGCRINDDFDAIIVARALNAQLRPNGGTGSSQPVAPVVSSGDNGGAKTE